MDRLVSSYDERLDMICGEIGEVLQHSDLRRSRSHALVLDISKAGQKVYAPGSKGGKFYRDGVGHIRYGEAPMPQYKQQASETHTTPQIDHYRPRPFMGMNGLDKDLTSFLMMNGGKYGFKKPELRFLGNWYGTGNKSGSLFDAFLDCAMLTHEDLTGDIAQLRFGGKKLTYEEAVFEFFAAQRELFMGTEGGGGEADEEWDTILNDKIRPMLDSVFSKYEALKESEDFKADYAAEPDKLRRKFFDSARKHRQSTMKIADHITSGWDPAKQVAEVVVGLKKLGLIAKPSMTDNHAELHGREHLKGSTAFDDRLLSDHGNPLISKPEKLAELTASQLMLLYIGAELNRRWDPDSRSYSDEAQQEVGPGALGEVAIDALSSKSEQWAEAAALSRKHLDKVVDNVVLALNEENAHLEEPKKAKK